MDRNKDGSEHNICSNREGLCPGKEPHGASGWKKIFQHGKEPLRNKDSVSQYCNKKAAASLILNENVSENLCIFSIDKNQLLSDIIRPERHPFCSAKKQH